MLHSRHGHGPENVPTQVSKGRDARGESLGIGRVCERKRVFEQKSHSWRVGEGSCLDKWGCTQWCKETYLCSDKCILFSKGLGAVPSDRNPPDMQI